MKYFKHFLYALLWVAIGCDSGEPTRRNDSHYFPLRTRLYHIYDVSEINYTLGIPESISYQLKTVVVDSFLNVDDVYTYVVQRSRRMDDGDDWTALDTWTIAKSATEVIVSEGNTPFVVLTFPLYKNTEWNGNKYNTEVNPTTKENEDMYRVEKMGIDYNPGTGVTYPNCVVVNQEDNQEFVVFLDQRKEVYAPGIGLIAKETTGLLFCNDQNRDCIGKQVVDDGVIYKQVLNEYGID